MMLSLTYVNWSRALKVAVLKAIGVLLARSVTVSVVRLPTPSTTSGCSTTRFDDRVPPETCRR